MTDREMLMFAYGALRGKNFDTKTENKTIQIIEDHLFPKPLPIFPFFNLPTLQNGEHCVVKSADEMKAEMNEKHAAERREADDDGRRM